jgi:diguanylate cyclase (GGDEF)-like protein
MRSLAGSIRSLFPRLESIYVASRTITAVSVVLWMLTAAQTESTHRALTYGMVIFLVHLLIFYFVWRRRPKFISEVFAYSLIFDIIFVTYLIKYTGGANSGFFLLYYVAIMFSAYYFSLNTCVAISFAITTVYIVSNPELLTKFSLIELGLRVGFAWFFAYAVGYVSRHMKQSESKLLKLLDTLNESTTELERSQARVETIYETSRVLGEIHDDKEITDNVLEIAEDILGFEMCSVQLLAASRGFLLERARLQGSEKRTEKLREQLPLEGLAGEVIQSGSGKRLFDLEGVPGYVSTLESAKSALIVPMISHGKVLGLLQAESVKVNRFSDMDQKVFSILAASAAMAYENSRLHRELEKMVIIDELTGVYNYRYFSEKLADEKKRAARYRQPLSLLMVDIDWFKRCNDTFGHEAGNVLLKGVVNVIKVNIRDTDILARYGGEEFIVILPQTLHDDAHIIAERIRLEVEGSSFGGGAKSPILRATVSIGVTTFPDNGRNEDEIVQLVDRAMYIAKGQGKNAVATV